LRRRQLPRPVDAQLRSRHCPRPEPRPARLSGAARGRLPRAVTSRITGTDRLDAEHAPPRSLPPLSAAAFRGCTRILGRSSKRGVGGHRRGGQVGALLRPVPAPRPAAGPCTAQRQRSPARRDALAARRLLQPAVGYLPLAVAVPRLLLAFRHGPDGPRSELL